MGDSVRQVPPPQAGGLTHAEGLTRKKTRKEGPCPLVPTSSPELTGTATTRSPGSSRLRTWDEAHLLPRVAAVGASAPRMTGADSSQ